MLPALSTATSWGSHSECEPAVKAATRLSAQFASAVGSDSEAATQQTLSSSQRHRGHGREERKGDDEQYEVEAGIGFCRRPPAAAQETASTSSGAGREVKWTPRRGKLNARTIT
jgi:hypothetical protein